MDLWGVWRDMILEKMVFFGGKIQRMSFILEKTIGIRGHHELILKQEKVQINSLS